MNTITLVKKAKDGDKDALVELIMAQKKDYYKLAFIYMKNKEDALDAMEDMIVILYENIHRLKDEGAFYRWSKTILSNCCKRLLRDKKRVVPLAEIKEDASEVGYGQKDNQIMLDQYLSSLSDKHQEIIKLRYILDLDYQSISDLLKIPLGTVKSRIYTALAHLKKNFGGDRYE